MPTTSSLDRGLLVLRLAIGSVFIAHGAQKLFEFGLTGTAGFLESVGVPFATLNALALIAVELGGGLAILTGLFTRAAAVLTAFAMLVAVTVVHLPNGYFLPNGMEFALTLLLGSVAVTQTGAGHYSVDAWLAERRPAVARVNMELRRAA